MKGDSVVKQIQIKNFRSLKDTKMQTLSPITVLVGENSSGKSTFLRAFPLLKQSISKRTSGPILWAGDADDYVDFGSFEETVTNDGSNAIAFTFQFKLDDDSLFNRIRFYDDDDDELRADKLILDISNEITITSSNGSDHVSKMRLGINSTTLGFDFDTKTVTTESGFSYTEAGIDELMPENAKSTRASLRRYYSGSHCFGFRLPSIDTLIEQVFQSFPPEETADIDSYDIRMMLYEIGAELINTGKVSSIEEAEKRTRQMPEYAGIYNRLVSNIQENTDKNLMEVAKIVAGYSFYRKIDEYLYYYFRSIHYIAPLRATAERYYRLRNLAVDEVDYQGKNLPIFINSLDDEQIADFNAWTNEHFGFCVSTDKSKGHLSLQIQLQGSDKSINLSDTGFGYSQVLPIITQLWELTSRKKESRPMYLERNQRIPIVVAIEQPELHLHPAVQARLAKAFIACIDLARKNQCDIQLLIETHSETIVNYLGRAIARGLLKPDDVSVILFEKGIDQSVTTVSNSGYDEDGYLVNWPYGFFDSEE